MDEIGIETGYTVRCDTLAWDDEGMSEEYQAEVYDTAKRFGNSAIDIGCGSAFKLVTRFRRTVGIELEPMLRILREKYCSRRWVSWEEARRGVGHYSVAICADVIEHVMDPVRLLRDISELGWDRLVISTPARPQTDMGPPRNPHHVREWSRFGFPILIGKFFHVDLHFSYHDKDGSVGQVVVAKRRSSLHVEDSV